ncbi:unnamed protein product [Brugia pahangi]|uniref:Uncharacterized protein n=1 Tax=Brugia pahangi TaxID=6280 RepID=A0A0N4T3A7_BRUPA|nr:unnamed protein product [Brugia pahangi]
MMMEENGVLQIPSHFVGPIGEEGRGGATVRLTPRVSPLEETTIYLPSAVTASPKLYCAEP